MKKALLFVLFAFACLLTNAQEFSKPLKVDKAKPAKAGSQWLGGGFDMFYTGTQKGDHFFIAGSEFSEIEAGNQITKVKFFHYLGKIKFTNGDSLIFTNTSYTIKIYENPVLGGIYAAGGLYDTTLGTPVYAQTIILGAAESDTEYELTLETPYTVNSNDFWISISFNDGIGAMLLSSDPSMNYNGVYYMYYPFPGYGTFVINTDFGESGNPEYYALGISIYNDNGEPPVPEVDLGAFFFDSNSDEITSVNLSATESLSFAPGVWNYGADSTSQPITLTATANSKELVNFTIPQTTIGADTGYIYDLYTFTANQLDSLGLTGTFNVVLSVPYTDDADPSDNTETLTVTRAGSSKISSAIDINTINIYPNPATDYITISGLAEKATVSIYNLSGSKVKTCIVDEQEPIAIDLGHGIYFVKIEIDGKETTRKLIVK